MQLSISRCITCNKHRLVDRMPGGWVCFSCKQRVNKVPRIKLQAMLPN